MISTPIISQDFSWKGTKTELQKKRWVPQEKAVKGKKKEQGETKQEQMNKWEVWLHWVRKKNILTSFKMPVWPIRPNKRLHLKVLSRLWEQQTKISVTK